MVSGRLILRLRCCGPNFGLRSIFAAVSIQSELIHEIAARKETKLHALKAFFHTGCEAVHCVAVPCDAARLRTATHVDAFTPSSCGGCGRHRIRCEWTLIHSGRVHKFYLKFIEWTIQSYIRIHSFSAALWMWTMRMPHSRPYRIRAAP